MIWLVCQKSWLDFYLILLRPLVVMFKLVDNSTDRKDYIGKIKLKGGICIFIGILASQIYLNEFDKTIIIILITFSIILILGVLEDIVNLKVEYKLFVQFFLIFLTIYFSNKSLSF